MSVHDVAPCWERPVATIVKALRQRLGEAFSVAVVPAWGGQQLDARRDEAMLSRLAGLEVLLHGYEHRATRASLVGWLTEGSDELSGLDRGEAQARLGRGVEVLRAALGATPTGLVPPAWQRGPVDLRMMRALGLTHLIGLMRAWSTDGGERAVATRSWDTGRWSAAGRAGEALGRALEVGRRAIVQVVVHPRDVERGWLGRALASVDELQARGLSPARWGELLAQDRGGDTCGRSTR